jgi:hypothetical protein
MGELRNVGKILVGIGERKIKFRRPENRWKGNVKINLNDSSFRGVHRVHMYYYKV